MKFLILFSCALAAISAEYQAPYYGPQHVPVIGPNGVPLDTPANQAATKAHLAAVAAAGSRGPAQGPYNPAPYNPAPYNPAPYNQGPYNAPSQYNAPNQYNAPQGQSWRQTPPAYQTTNVIPKIGQNGVPQDTPEVEAAKRNHFAGYQQSHAALAHATSISGPGYGGQGGQGGHGGHYRKRRSLYSAPWVYGHATPVIDSNGVPLDTPEVQAAKAAHFAAHAEASTRVGALAVLGGPLLSHGYAAYPQHVPTIDSNGVPLDTPEVQQARAAHLAALNAAASRNVVGHVGAYSLAPWSYASGLIGHVGGPALIDHSGAPIETPEVQAAKAAHFAAHAAARGHHY